ncbi:hypothetical protein [Ralstonia mojiangensis]|uniref:hypothetical protein n=1 Tax=Ralstonia mojiangensis TaxID=2953895 RepID=UPI0020917082|nr:hypothetical protein [Ralstonia mojiangensis]MCO5410796.1 hypothetical protein [Ralstonia mojiangensis]
MRPLLLITACLTASPSFATVAWKCSYNGETFYVSMPCEDAIKRGITPPFKERPNPPECAALKRQKNALRAELEDAVSPPGKVPDEEVSRLDRSIADLGTEQHLRGCKNAAPVP